MTADVQITMSEVEQARLHHKERLIERGVQQVGEALRDIRNERLYRETHGTFEAYCEQRWGISPRHANRQIAAAEVADAMGPIGPNLSESQARELAPLRDDPDRLREVWEQANEATGGNVTAAAIRAARTPEADLIVNRETGEITDTPPKDPTRKESPMPTAAPARPPAPPKYGGNRRKHREQIDALVIAISGGLTAFEDVRAAADLDSTITSEEAARLADDLSLQIRSLNRIRNLLKECTK